MKEFSAILLVVMLSLMFTLNVYPDGLILKNKNPGRPAALSGSSGLFDNYTTYTYDGLFYKNNFSSRAGMSYRAPSWYKPRLSNKKIMGEILMGILGNLAFGTMGALVGWLIFDIGREDYDYWDNLGGAILGYFAGSAFGSALGVYVVGNSGNVKGSFGRALLGSTMGLGVAFATVFLIRFQPVAYAAFTVFPSIGAAILFNRSLRYKSAPGYGSALLNFRQGRMYFGVPLVNVQPLPGFTKMGKRFFRFNVNVLSIEL